MKIEGGLVCPIGLELAYLAAKQMSASVIVWDMETVPDLRGFAAAKGLVGKPDDDVRAEMGDKFPKLIYHSIVCIGALVAQRHDLSSQVNPLTF